MFDVTIKMNNKSEMDLEMLLKKYRGSISDHKTFERMIKEYINKLINNAYKLGKGGMELELKANNNLD